jgi:hypothetical protein
VQSACSLEDVEAIAARAVSQARGGDARAREWLSRYLLGIPGAAALKPSDIAWQDESGYDPVEARVADTRLMDQLLGGLFQDERSES